MVGKTPNMFFFFLSNQYFVTREQQNIKQTNNGQRLWNRVGVLSTAQWNLTLWVLQDQKIVNLSKLILFIIQSSSFLAYTWNPPSERVFTTEPFHAWWSTVPLIAYDDSIVPTSCPWVSEDGIMCACERNQTMIVASPACAFTWRTWYQTDLKLNTRVFAATYLAY